MGTALGAFAGLYLVVVILGVILAVAWIILPFALIGTKPILRELLREVRRTNALLEQRAAGKT